MVQLLMQTPCCVGGCAAISLLALCYSWLQVRPEFPAPQPGQLPLPRSLSPQLQQQLTGELPGWQQLPWPAGQVPQQPQPNPKAALQFKVGGRWRVL
jgi:hypothetical protein